MRVSLFALLLWLASSPSSCSAWTGSEWVGIVEAISGVVVLGPQVSPSSDVCENCDGTGRLGDGTVSVVCPVCEGTGKPKSPGNPGTSLEGREASLIIDFPGKMKASPTPPGKDAPAVKQEAATSGGGTYKRGLFRRR